MAPVVALIGVLLVLTAAFLALRVDLFERFVASLVQRLYLVAAVRVALGVFLLYAASACRLPQVLRVLGLLAIIGGLLTPLMGRRVASWWLKSSPALVRAWVVVAAAVGGLLVYAGS